MLTSLRSKLEGKASDFESAKLKSIEAAKSGMNDLRTLMDFVENNILKEIEDSFEINKFANALERLNEKNDEEISESEASKLINIAFEDVPSPLGPTKRDFLKGQEIIIGLNSWYNKKSLYLPEHIEGRCAGVDCVELVWSKVDEAVIYHVEMRYPNEGAFHRVYEGNETSYKLSGLCPGTRVLFRLRSVFGNGGVSEWSECVEASITSSVLTQYLCAEGRSDSEIVVHWDRVDVPGGDEAITYHVEMRPKNKEADSFKEVYSGNENRCTVRGLENEEEYLFLVKTTCGSRCTNHSNIAIGKTMLPIPKKFQVKTNAWDEIVITWDPVVSKAGGGSTSYIVEGKSEHDSEFTEMYNGPKTKIRKTAFRQDTEYSFRVKTKCGNEESQWSDVVNIRTQSIPTPNNFTVTAESWDTISLSWDRVSSNTGEPINYIVKTKEGSSKKFTEIYRGTETHFTMTDIKHNTEYSFCVRSVWKEYGSEWSDTMKIRTEEIPTPVNFVVKANTWGSAVLSWKPVISKSGELIIYAVEMRNENSNRFTEIYRGEETRFTKTDLKQDSEYSFRVRSIIRNEMSEWSCIRMIRTQKIFAPNNFRATTTTSDSVTLTWDSVEGASCYQIEVNENLSDEQIRQNIFVKKGLFPDTEYKFRIRTMIKNDASDWSDAVKARTQEAPDFSECAWKECPEYAHPDNRYSVNETNRRIVTRNNDKNYCCTIVWNTPLPLDKTISWNIKILESQDNNGNGVFIGVALLNIFPFGFDNRYNNGWYFNCWNSTLDSGSPHNYDGKIYGPRKTNEKYVHTGDSIGVIMDTTKGDLSFVLGRVNLGVAYEEIPLDKPLVPCVLLYVKGNSVEIDTSELKETEVNSSIPVPSNITVKSITCDSITITWDGVESASFYQIEFDGKIFSHVNKEIQFTKRGLLADTEYSFRLRTVRGNSVGKWSDIVKERTAKESFETSGWKECPMPVENERKYFVNEINPRIAIPKRNWSTVIGNTPIPLNKLIQWIIKAPNPKHYNGYIGVTPFDINQNEDNTQYKCGWHINIRDFTLVSGLPHNYRNKEYIQSEQMRKVYTGDTVGVVMDTTKGNLSFALNGMNLGFAYEEIPLDKPLVPCAIVKGISVELII